MEAAVARRTAAPAVAVPRAPARVPAAVVAAAVAPEVAPVVRATKEFRISNIFKNYKNNSPRFYVSVLEGV